MLGISIEIAEGVIGTSRRDILASSLIEKTLLSSVRVLPPNDCDRTNEEPSSSTDIELIRPGPMLPSLQQKSTASSLKIHTHITRTYINTCTTHTHKLTNTRRKLQ